MRLEQSSIRNLQAAFVAAAISCTDRCGYSRGCCRVRGTWGCGEIQVLAAACAKAPLGAEVGHCPRAHTVAGFHVQGAAQARSFSRDKLPSPGCPGKGSFQCLLGLMNYCSGSSAYGREVWRCLCQWWGPCWESFPAPIPVTVRWAPLPCPALPSSGVPSHCSSAQLAAARRCCWWVAAEFPETSTRRREL